MPRPSHYSAVLFDLDGTLIETERMVIDAGVAALQALNLPPRRDLLVAMVGTVTEQSWATLQQGLGDDFDLSAFEREWQDQIDRAFLGEIPQRPGAARLLQVLVDRGLPIAVATNSTTGAAIANLRRAGLLGFFGEARVFGRDQVDRPKPAPDVFLLAAQRLGADPATCLVFEDSDPGAAGGLAAGMTVVQVPDQRPPAGRDAHYLSDSLLAGARAAGLTGPEDEMDDLTRLRIEAAAFRRLRQHLIEERPDVQNIDLMNLAGFCRNCLSRWMQEAAEAEGIAMTKDEGRALYYGMPYADWVAAHQTPADQATQDRFARTQASQDGPGGSDG
jgi:HAD superfamily hydrolase (TIGR01509 family)